MNLVKQVCVGAVMAFCSVQVAFADGDKVKDLNDWSGSWVSVIDVMKNPSINDELKKTYDELGKKAGISGQEWKNNKMKAWDSSEIESMEITATKISIVLKDGSKIDNTYQYKGEISLPYKEGKTLNWYTFEGDKNNAYKFMAFRPSGKAENLSHFHFKNSAESFDQLKNGKVFKTMVSPKTTASQLAGDFKE